MILVSHASFPPPTSSMPYSISCPMAITVKSLEFEAMQKRVCMSAISIPTVTCVRRDRVALGIGHTEAFGLDRDISLTLFGNGNE